MFCNYTHKYKPFLVFHKDSTHNQQILFKVNNKSSRKKYKDLPEVNQNIQTTLQICVSTLSNWHLCAELLFH